jgi:four helix bundle protein
LEGVRFIGRLQPLFRLLSPVFFFSLRTFQSIDHYHSMAVHTAPAKDFRELIVWQKAHDFVLGVYAVTRQFPPEERFCLTSQIRRSAVSVPANIAEGFRRKSSSEKIRFLNIAEASLEETRYYLILAVDLQYAPTAHLQQQAETVQKLLYSYSSAIRRSLQNTER